MKLATERRMTTFVFLLIPAVLFIAFFIYPLIRTVILSFHRWDGISPAMTAIGTRNYVRLLQNYRFQTALLNNAKWLVFYLLLPTSLGLGLALTMDQKFKEGGFFKTVFFLPYTITPVAVAAIWRWLYEPHNGLINRALTALGLGSLTTAWLGNTQLATYAIMVSVLWWTTGFCFVLYLSGIRNIPIELIEAAKIDGATFGQLFRKVLFPMLLPTTIVVLALSAISAMRIFDLIYALTGGGPAYATEVLATLMYDLSFGRFDMGMGSAVAIILLLLSAVIIVPYVIYSTGKLEDIRS